MTFHTHPVNADPKGSVFTVLEYKLGRLLQWFIYQLLAKELPLRHLIQKLDSKTTVPQSFTGEIGKNHHDCELTIKGFAKINLKMSPLDQAIVNDLSTN